MVNAGYTHNCVWYGQCTKKTKCRVWKRLLRKNIHGTERVDSNVLCILKYSERMI